MGSTRTFVVTLHWTSATHDDHFDADEIQVLARNAEEALFFGRARWEATIGAKWPDLRVDAVSVSRHSSGWGGILN